ncbi:MAG: ATP-binding protein [Candidatus Omnitrophica bacterium]|nr:ATP-binding protein [Candidatus Omnitrophota bacterium]
MRVQRDLIEKIKPFLKRKEFISIVGPRQSGKTTFLQILNDCLVKDFNINKDRIQIVTFEDRKLLMQFEKDAVSFVRSYARRGSKRKFYLMIDEFQYAKGGGQKLKLIYDTVKNIRIFITGSSSLDIKARVGKFMVGRILNFNLYPFNFREYLRTVDDRLERIYYQHNQEILQWLFAGRQCKKIKKGEDIFYEELSCEYEKFCIWGGYPAVVLAKTEIERKKILSDIYNNYILKDIKTLPELATEKNLFLLSQYLATQIGNIVVYKNLSQASQLDYRKLKKHLNILEETFVCKAIKPFFKNRQKELSKNPKVFFMDLGFRSNLVENMNALDKRSDAGAVIENSVFIRLIEICENVNKINFWRTKAGAEVDFVLHIRGDVVPVEVKYTNFTSAKISRSLGSFIDSFKPGYAIVLTKNYRASATKNNTTVLFLPVYYL